MRELSISELDLVSGAGPFDWVMGKIADFFANRAMQQTETNDTLDNFDPRDTESWFRGPSTNGDGVYTSSNEPNSWYVDRGDNGTIDAHVVRDGMGYYWVDNGNGYVNVGQDPAGNGF